MSRPPIVVAVLAVFILVLALGAAACGTIDSPPGAGGSDSTSSSSTTSTSAASPSGSSTSTSGSSTTLPAGAISHPTGATDVVIRIVTGGGFVPIEYNVTLIPEFTLYGDGRIVETGPTTLEYPGKALPNLQTAVVPESVVQTMLAAAKEAGLFQNGVDYGQPGVADVPTTTITVTAAGAAYTSQIYALGFSEGGNLTLQQQQARAAISDLVGKLEDPSTLTDVQPAWEAYDFTALKVFSRPVDTTASTESTDVRPNHLPWPLADLATAGKVVENAQGLREVVISGDDLTLLKPLLGQATQITLWKSGDKEYNLWLRPLLPDEAAALAK
jgi:hypothetical protein